MKTINKLLLTAFSVLSLSVPVSAFNICDLAWYASGTGSLTFHNDHDFKSTSTQYRDYDLGYGASAALGLDLCPVRLEIEGRFQRNGLDEVTTDGTSTRSVIGSTRDIALMLNAFVDFPVCDFISIYVGGGAGVAYSKIRFTNQDGVSLAAPTTNTNTGFAWQGMTGISYPLTECSEIFIGYRIFGAEKYDNEDGVKMEDLSITHSGDVGIRYYF